MSSTPIAARSSRLQELFRRGARITAPLARPLAGRRSFPLWAVVHHVGRTSSRLYALPVAIGGTDTHLYIPVPFGAGTQWVRNVMAAGGCTVTWRGRDIVASEPVLVDVSEASVAFNAFERRIMDAGLSTFLRLQR